MTDSKNNSQELVLSENVLVIDGGWSANPPGWTGDWWFSCGETNDEHQLAKVFISDRGLMMVDDPDGIGVCMLKYFHEGLTDIKWKPADSPIAVCELKNFEKF